MRWPQPFLIGGGSPGRTVSSALANYRQPLIDGGRMAAFAAWSPTASVPDGFAPYAWTPPITAGAMSCRADGRVTMSASLLKGGPMQAAATASMTMDAAGMSLTVGMTAPWTATYTPTANLRMTVGMTATYTATFTGSSNLAMIVPLGSTTFSAAFTGSSDLKGMLSMTAEFGGAEPLSPEGLARAVWEALATDYDTAGTMGAKLNSASSAGDPWTADPTAYAAGSAGAALVKAAKALKLGEFIALK